MAKITQYTCDRIQIILTQSYILGLDAHETRWQHKVIWVTRGEE